MQRILLGVALIATISGPVHAADKDAHQLTLNIPAQVRIQRVVDVQITGVMNGHSRAAHVHSIYNDDTIRTTEGYTVVRSRVGAAAAVPGDTDYSSPKWTAWLRDAADLTFTTGPYFYPRTVEDWPKVQARYLSVLTSTTSSSTNYMVRQAYTIMDSRNSPLKVLMSDTFMAYARKYPLTLGHPFTESATVPAPLGHGNVNATTTFTLAKWDAASDDAEIDYDFTIDPASMQDYVSRLAPQLLPAASAAEIQAHMPQINLDTSSHCHYTASITTGLIRQGLCTQTIVTHVLDYDETRKTTYVVSETLAQ